MKLKKIASGVVAVLTLSCSMLSALTASGAENTVKISASNEVASAGSQFTVSVSLSDIPDTGIQGADFAVKYDDSIVAINKVEIGKLAQTGAEEADDIAELPVFATGISKGKSAVVVSFTVADGNSKYYMHGEGVMFTITGTVLENAPAGSVAKFSIIPTPRKVNDSGTPANVNKIFLGYDSDPNPDDDISNYIFYNSEVSDGSVTVSGSDKKGVKGDANDDGFVEIADVVAIAAYIGNKSSNPLSQEALSLCDVHNTGDGITANDLLMIQQYLAQIVTEL